MLRHFDQTQLVMKNEISKQKLRLLFHNFGTDFSRVQKKRQETNIEIVQSFRLPTKS